jgi:hypothetical protein
LLLACRDLALCSFRFGDVTFRFGGTLYRVGGASLLFGGAPFLFGGCFGGVLSSLSGALFLFCGCFGGALSSLSGAPFVFGIAPSLPPRLCAPLIVLARHPARDARPPALPPVRFVFVCQGRPANLPRFARPLP